MRDYHGCRLVCYSATRDNRFRPVSQDELHRLHVSVSILLNFEEVDSYLDWEVRILTSVDIKSYFFGDMRQHFKQYTS